VLPEAPNEPQLLFYCDPVECLQFLAENPAFEGHQSYAPVKFFTDAKCTDWVFGDVNSGDAWHYYQSKYAPGGTVNPGIVGPDKTHVTNFSGDGKVHPVYITSAQISGDICAQPSH
jgi:hypothetical protein